MSGHLPKAAEMGLAGCDGCGKVVAASVHDCPRCGSRIHVRKPASITRTVAFLLAAACLYVPANILPVMTISEWGNTMDSTILEGMVEFWKREAYPIAIVIFAASIMIPLIKIVALGWLCAAATGRVHPSPRLLGRIYWFTELLGRWSMVDIFVVSILVALVRFGTVMTVLPRPGALAFAGVVILTMLAAASFDPRLLWDRLDLEQSPPSVAPEPRS